MTFTVRQLAEQARIYSTKEIRQTTYENWNKALHPDLPVSIGEIPVTAVDFELVREYRVRNLHQNNGPWSRNTLATRLNSLTSIWNIAIKEQLLPVGTTNLWQGWAKHYALNRRESRPEFHEWDFYKEYHDDPLFNLYWYHGFRSGEGAGLLPEDVKLDAAVPHFNIRHNSIRLLKNDASPRLVPIHEKCIAIAEDLSLFPFSRAKRCGNSWSSRFHKSLGLPPKEAAKTLRHSWRTRASRARIGWNFQVAIMGHVMQGHTFDYGELLLEDINDELQKIR